MPALSRSHAVRSLVGGSWLAISMACVKVEKGIEVSKGSGAEKDKVCRYTKQE